MESLQEQIQQCINAIVKDAPKEIVETMMKATADLKNSGIEDKSLKTGDLAPKFTLKNHKNEECVLTDVLSDSVVVLNFYRGGWCPYCNLELNALQLALPEIKQYGGSLVAISPETPDNSLSTIEKNNLEFEILYDHGNQLAEEFGLVFELPESLKPIYDSFGLNIPAYNGDDSYRLPMPATYIIGPQGKILYHFIDADYTKRAEPDEIISILKNIKGKVSI